MFTLIAIALTVIASVMILQGPWHTITWTNRAGFFVMCLAIGFWILVWVLIGFDLIPWLVRVLL